VGQAAEVPDTPRPRDRRVGSAVRAVDFPALVGEAYLFGLVVAREFGKYELLARKSGTDYLGQKRHHPLSTELLLEDGHMPLELFPAIPSLQDQAVHLIQTARVVAYVQREVVVLPGF
jgi:hypothetical protein